MEEYKLVSEIDESVPTITYGNYYYKVHSKHIASYGDFGANNIGENIKRTFIESLVQYNNPNKNNNILLVGKVQSGKTSNLELYTALALDNGFNLVVIYGGYDNTLLAQTKSRFQKTFDIAEEVDYDTDDPVIITSDDQEMLSIDDITLEDLRDANKPIFIISMKRPVALKKINKFLKRIDKTRIKAFVIDDEGDQASLNTKKNKREDASATYDTIVKMKSILGDPIYLSVTATPHALVFLNDYSKLRPDAIRLIEPGKGYCGAEKYHLYDSNKIELVKESDQDDLESGNLPDSLRKALYHYIIASAIMFKRGIKKSDMIIHSHRNVSHHKSIYSCVSAFKDELCDLYKYNDEISLRIKYEEMKKVFQKSFSAEVQNQYDFDDLKDEIKRVVLRIHPVMKNSEGASTENTRGTHKYSIYIGGDLLQRGVTFDKLVTTYFTRWAQDGGNMDTNLQRARWFGYREKYIDLCRIFTTYEISREFTNLSEVETDLWEQFYSIEKNEMAIDDILIKAENTRMRPSRRNVIDIKSVSFKTQWIKQRTGVFDRNQINANNAIVDELRNQLSLVPTYEGRKNADIETGEYSIVEASKLVNLIGQMQNVFEAKPFEKKALQDLLTNVETIPVIFMHTPEDKEGRQRSFYQDNKIFALQQGADKNDPEKAVYFGDKYVIVDKNKINIQIYRVLPMKADENGEKVLMPDCVQYMFAVYVPKKYTYYVRET